MLALCQHFFIFHFRPSAVQLLGQVSNRSLVVVGGVEMAAANVRTLLRHRSVLGGSEDFIGAGIGTESKLRSCPPHLYVWFFLPLEESHGAGTAMFYCFSVAVVVGVLQSPTTSTAPSSHFAARNLDFRSMLWVGLWPAAEGARFFR